jgi:ABC-2 type transport system ATP-binding protein
MIEAVNLTKRYGGRVAVDDLSFTVRPGRVTGFLGPNGAGKSTTMRLILGLDRPSRGTVTVSGVAYRSLRRPLFHAGALLDATAVPAGRSARGHLAALAASNGIGRRRVGEVLAEVGLSGVAHKRVGTFSLGMKQRLGIAAALLGDPPVLIFDEPVNGLDPQGIRWIRDLFRDLARGQGRTVLVSSHLMAEMALTADELIVIGQGRLVAQTTVAEATAATGHVVVRSSRAGELATLLYGPGVTVTSTGGEGLRVDGLDAHRIGDAAAQAGIPLYELTTATASLEEAFMALTESDVEYASTAPESVRDAHPGDSPAVAALPRKEIA